MRGWAHDESSWETILTANWDNWQNNHTAPCQCQESSLHPCKAVNPSTVTMLELSPEDELAAASQHGMAGKTGMG